MGKRTGAKGARVSNRNGKRVSPDPFRFFKAIILIVLAVLSLAAGIYKGGEGLFFGVVFAMGCGLIGVLFLVRDGTTKTKASRE